MAPHKIGEGGVFISCNEIQILTKTFRINQKLVKLTNIINIKIVIGKIT